MAMALQQMTQLVFHSWKPCESTLRAMDLALHLEDRDTMAAWLLKHEIRTLKPLLLVCCAGAKGK